MNLNYDSSSDESIKVKPKINKDEILKKKIKLPDANSIFNNNFVKNNDIYTENLKIIEEQRNINNEDYHNVPPPQFLLSKENENESRYAKYNKRKESNNLKKDYECPVVNKFVRLNDETKKFTYENEEKKNEKSNFTQKMLFKPPQITNKKSNNPTI